MTSPPAASSGTAKLDARRDPTPIGTKKTDPRHSSERPDSMRNSNATRIRKRRSQPTSAAGGKEP